MARCLRSIFASLALVFAFCGVALSQEAPSPSAVLTIDPEQLFAATLFGKRVLADSEILATELQTENRRIEADLSEEERELTELRPSLSVEEFRALADAFDTKVSQIRSEQDAKARDVQKFRETGQQGFFGQIGPVLLEIVRDRNAAVILNRRNVFLSVDSVDITEEAIERIDASLGDGRDVTLPESGAD